MAQLPFGPERMDIGPDAVLVAGWLHEDAQQRLAKACLQWLDGPIPAASPRMPRGGQMSVEMACLGWHWRPYEYVQEVDGVSVPPVPGWLVDLARKAVDETVSEEGYEPDAVLVNSYSPSAHMGMHQDNDEVVDAPVVSISLGNSCKFRFGNSKTRNKPFTDVQLRSGDLFVFGGQSRFAFHGVMKTFANTAPASLNIGDRRINLTIRQTGLRGVRSN